MTHLVFIESSGPGLRAMQHAKSSGYEVTCIRSGAFDWLLKEEELVKLSSYADRIVTVADTQNIECVADALATIKKESSIDSILTTTHYCMVATAGAAEKQGLKSTGLQGILNARDKVISRNLLKDNNLLSVRYGQVNNIEIALKCAQSVGYPLIMKPTTGMGKILTAIINNDEELKAHFAEALKEFDGIEQTIKNEVSFDFILEEIAVGPMYSVEFAVNGKGQSESLVILKRKRGKHNPILEMGSVIPSGLNESEVKQVNDYVRNVINALGLDIGIFHVELIFTTDGPKLIEVNPRTAGGAIPDLIRAATGVDLFEVLVKIFAGVDFPLQFLKENFATSHTYIATIEDCAVRNDLPQDWFEQYRSRIFEGYCDITAGQIIRKMDSNYGTYGVVRVRTQTPEEALAQTEILRQEIQENLKLNLVEIMD